MKTKVHKSLAWLMSLAMIVMLLPMSALAVSTDATLSALTYTVGAGSPIAVPEFSASTDTYSIELPYGTNATASIALTGTVNDSNATITTNDGTTLSGGSGTATITATAQDTSTTKTYTLNFTTAAASPYTFGTIGNEVTGSGAGITRTITTNGVTGDQYLVIQITEGSGTSAKVSVVMVKAADSVEVSYKNTAAVQAWITSGMPTLSGPAGATGATIYDTATAN